MSLAIRILTLFPDMVRTVLQTSIPGRAAKQGLVEFDVVDIRDYAADKHGTVDDYPYGGGAGMIMMAPPVVEAVEATRRDPDAPLLLMSPRGERLAEALVLDLLAESREAGEVVMICGHYKGLDQRINDLLKPREISIGDYVLSGGELPALIVADAMIRRIHGRAGRPDRGELVHAPPGIQGIGGAGDPALGASRPDRGLAA